MSASSDPNSTVRAQDSMGDLKLHLREVIAEPTDLIKKGTAPPPYFFAFEPSGRSQEQAQKFAALLGGSALARIFAGMNLVRSNPDHSGGDETSTTRHYSLSNPREYVAAFNEKTEAAINAFTKGPLASMYRPCDGGATASQDLECTRAELHDMVLPRIFGGLDQVGKAHLAELDKVLTRFTAALKPFQVSTTSDSQDGHEGYGGSQPLPELKHAVVVNYVKSIDITGGSGGIYVHKPYTRVAIFSVKPQHWASALQKPTPSQQGPTFTSASEEAEAAEVANHHNAADAAAATGKSVIGSLSGLFGGKPKPKPPKPDERIKFTLNTTILELEFDDAKYHANKAKFEGIFKGMAEEDEELGPIAESGGLHALGRSTCMIYQAGEV
ncbi:hypothetical protein QBC36DRAFT_334304 [Triangularia setosa]|uniref:Uncharacterized protein n=1 Tax=Triangularia setosa TaxID=2587417 RepID=A0AAN6W2I4_9PEZI|nr:hypothetical protein QBC36DRAFT_334304 [Podospora setosa]